MVIWHHRGPSDILLVPLGTGGDVPAPRAAPAAEVLVVTKTSGMETSVPGPLLQAGVPRDEGTCQLGTRGQGPQMHPLAWGR